MNIPDNVTYVLKYLVFPVVFAVLFFAGLKDAPVQIIIFIVLMFTAFEVSLIPYDIGKSIEDEIHPYKYLIRATPIYHGSVGPKGIKYYSRNGLLLAKFLQIILWPLFLAPLALIIYVLIK